MSTRSRIGIQLSDESILSVYHHWDGYPTWLGKVLNTHYSSKEKVAELIDGGDMSSCWSDSIWGDKLPEGEYAPEYYSARGENCPPVLMSRNEYLIKDNNEEYAYIYHNGEWECYNMNEFDKSKDPETVKLDCDATI